jgi:PAS domain S-box-containing protein
MALRKTAPKQDRELGIPSQVLLQIVDTIPHMVWTARADGEIQYLNALVLEYTGLGEKEIRAGRWLEVLHPDEADAVVERWEKALRTGKGFEAEYRLRRADGEYRWHAYCAIPLRDGDGRIQLWYGTSTDIDARKKSEQRLEQARRTLEAMVAARTQALSESGQGLRAFLSSVPAIAWIKDSRLRYAWVSESYERLLGKSLQALHGKQNTDVWPEEVARRYRRVDEQVLRGNRPMQSIQRHTYGDGRVGQLLVVKFPLADETGAPGVAATAS